MTAPANTSKDPFSLFEAHLWGVLFSFAPFAALVKPNNTINLTGPNDQPFKASMVGADTPEVLLLPNGGTVINRTSSGRCWVQKYALGLVTEELRVNTPDALNPLKWATFRALTLAEREGRLKGFPTVISVDFLNYSESMADPSPIERKVRGWKSVIDVDATFSFSYAELVA